MMDWMRGTLSVAGLAATLAVAGCASSPSNTANLNTIGQPAQLRPVQGSTVAQGTLPAIGVAGTPAPGLGGQPVLGGVPPAQPGFGTTPGALPPIGSTTTTAAANGSFVTLDPLAQPMGAGVSSGPEGVWTVVSGANQCRLNLPLTAKEGTTRYRASAPGCTLPGLQTVASWQQIGNQVQIFDENNNIVAAVAQSSGRYIGTLAGGQAISMQR